jgi:hypothetical protein
MPGLNPADKIQGWSGSCLSEESEPKEQQKRGSLHDREKLCGV